MTRIAIWHCYWYGPHETIVLVAGSDEELRTKVREAIAAGWYPEDQGPMPEDWDDLMEAYEETDDGSCYFAGWDCEEIEVQP